MVKTFKDLKQLNNIDSSFYDEDYYVNGGISWVDEETRMRQYSGFLTKTWDAGWKIITDGMKSIISDPKNILDLGCDMGSFVDYLIRTEYGRNVYGIDYSEYAINHPMGKSKGHIINANMMDIPFENSYFDLVTGFDVWEHLWIDDLDKIINEVDRIASKYLMLVIPCVSKDLPYKRFIFGKNDKIADIKDEQYLRQLAKGHVITMERKWWERQFPWKLEKEMMKKLTSSKDWNRLGLAWSKKMIFIYNKE